jgi:uncharacterized SAM-binding protein YcdF (DUF218 family)
VATAIVVPGHGHLALDGAHRLSDRGLKLVAEAGRLAERLHPDVVVLTGWSSTGGPSEADQMREAWDGPDVELLVEPTARTTVENASRTLPLLVERATTGAVVVCMPLHLVRVRLAFGVLFRGTGIALRYHVVRARPSVGALAWEIAALPLLPFQVAAARGELDQARRG